VGQEPSSHSIRSLIGVQSQFLLTRKLRCRPYLSAVVLIMLTRCCPKNGDVPKSPLPKRKMAAYAVGRHENKLNNLILVCIAVPTAPALRQSGWVPGTAQEYRV
jgi:hypothetical protein